MTFFYNYDLEEGPPKLVIKWINQMKNMPFNVKTWWFIIHTAEPINHINKSPKP